jgi:hypothetical protein
LELLSEEPVFTEAAIYLTMFRHHGGEYIAKCAKGQCRYLGQSLFSMKKQVLTLHHCAVPFKRIYSIYGVLSPVRLVARFVTT